MNKELTPEQTAALNILNMHVDAEMKGDIEVTLSTMSANPHVNHVPTLVGGIGTSAVRDFYQNIVPSKTFFPADVEMVEISKTIDQNQIVLEMIIKFTHTSKVEWMLPGIDATGKRIEVPLVVIAGIRDGKVTHEHIYWDQAGVLVQLGLINSHDLPIQGIDATRHMENILNKMQLEK